MGISRSAALALVLLLQGHGLTGDGVRAALADIIRLSPEAWPNPLVIHHGLFLLGGSNAVQAWSDTILCHSFLL